MRRREDPRHGHARPRTPCPAARRARQPCSRAKPSSSLGSSPCAAISASSAAATQSSSSAGTAACGLWPSASLVGLSSRPTTPFERRRQREQQQPAYAERGAPASASAASRAPAAPTVAPSSTSAGKPATAWPPPRGRTSRGSVPNVQRVSPVRSTLGGGGRARSAATVRRELAPQRRRGPCPRRATRPSSPTTRNVEPQVRRAPWPGPRRRAARSTPVGRPQLALQRVEQRLRRRGRPIAAAPPRAVSGAGTKLRRSALGSDRISAVTSSCAQARAPASRTRPAAAWLSTRQRDVDGDAVGGGARLELVASAAARGRPAASVSG